MNSIQKFNHKQFGEIRMVEINDEPYFVGADIATALGYSNSRKALNDHVDTDDKDVTKCDTLGGTQQMTVINESGMYSLVFASKLPQAKQFKHWVTSEVLPSIRKNGGYMVASDEETAEETMARAVLLAQDAIARRDKRIIELQEENTKQNLLIEQMKDKVSYLDMILSCKDSITITSIAKDYGMSAYKMNELLHKLKIQYKQGEQWFLYAKYDSQGYVVGIDVPIKNENGEVTRVKRNTQWTQKGRLFLYNTLKDNDILPLIER